MNLSKNSVSTVLFSTKEAKRNGNDPKAPMNPDAPEKRRLGFCILREGGVPIGMPGPILYWQTTNHETCGHSQGNHNMLLVSGLIFQSIGCIIPVQNRKNGQHSNWKIFGGAIQTYYYSKDARER